MGMSASQARFLSITARMHDLEFQAQNLENSKLELSDDSNIAYENYSEEINATKYQVSVYNYGSENLKVDATYSTLIASGSSPDHPMYFLSDATTDNIYIPEQIVNEMGGKIPGTLDEFLEIVGKSYLYSGNYSSLNDRNTEKTTADGYKYYGYDDDGAILQQMKSDGYDNYWTAIYYQLAGYTDNEGNSYAGHGFVSISNASATDRDWLKKQIENGTAILNKMQTVSQEVGSKSINIFSQTNMATDQDMSIVTDQERVDRAESAYENEVKNINKKEKQIDLQLARIENEHNALKTEYDTVKELIKKNIESSYKTFNA